MAEDADGPSNNQVHYTIVSGNQGNPFSIDPLKGEVKVARHLDREKVHTHTHIFLYIYSFFLLLSYCVCVYV